MLNAIRPPEATYTSLGKLYKLKKNERKTPPMPTRPAKNPELAPPNKAKNAVCGMRILGRYTISRGYTSRTDANPFLSAAGESKPTNCAPVKLPTAPAPIKKRLMRLKLPRNTVTL